MRSLLSAVVVCAKSSSTDQDIAYTNFTSAIGLSVVTSESLNEHTSELILASHEDSVVRNEYVIEYNQSLNTTELGVTCIHRSTLKFSCIAGLTADDHCDALSICRYCEGYCVILVIRTHSDGRHYDNFLRVDDTGLVSFCTFYNDTVCSSFNDVQIQIRISLSVRSKSSVTLRVCHSAVNG